MTIVVTPQELFETACDLDEYAGIFITDYDRLQSSIADLDLDDLDSYEAILALDGYGLIVTDEDMLAEELGVEA